MGQRVNVRLLQLLYTLGLRQGRSLTLEPVGQLKRLLIEPQVPSYLCLPSAGLHMYITVAAFHVRIRDLNSSPHESSSSPTEPLAPSFYIS